MKIKFVDLNSGLVEKVKKLGITAICGDYFLNAYKTERPVLVTASNPMFTFGGGIDAQFVRHFPELCRYKRTRADVGMERISNVIFAITVDENCKSTKEAVKQALIFASEHVCKGETMVVSGLGTGIGGLSADDFVEVMIGLQASLGF